MSRFRSRSLTDKFPNVVSITNDLDSIPPTVYNEEPWWVHNQSMTDELTPEYFSLKKEGKLLPVNEMSQTGYFDVNYRTTCETNWTGIHSPSQTSVVSLKGSLAANVWWRHTYSSQDRLPKSWRGPAVEPNPESANVLLTEAVARARTKALDFGTFVVEFHKTIAMIANFRTNVFKRAHSIVDSKRRQIAREGLSVFSQTWLEGRYGWRILAYELNDIREAIDTLKSSTWNQYGRAYAQDSDTVTHIETAEHTAVAMRRPGGFIFSNNRSRASLVLTQEKTSTVRAGAMIELIMDDILFIDPLVTTWEVIPFSFIVDWFTNIGTAIEGFSPLAVGDLVKTWQSNNYSITSNLDVLALPWVVSDPIYTVDGTMTDNATTTLRTYDRIEVNPPTMPSLTFRLNLDWRKLVDLAAITVTARLNLMDKIRKIVRL